MAQKFKYKFNNKNHRLTVEWFRGDHTNYLPTKQDLQEDDQALDKYILRGWLPESPFLRKNSNIIALGSCFAREISIYLAERGYTSLAEVVTRENASKTLKHAGNINEGVNNTFALRQLFEWAFLGNQPNEETWHAGDKSVIVRDAKKQTKTP